jgi:ABC-type transporter Mla maintaining outer membrane lipid asymmetry ATPase subunit MlaF
MSDASIQQSAPPVEMNDVAVGSRENLGATVVGRVNWTVASGEYWVVGGMHNSGKSDFLAMTAGLTAPKQGTYKLFGAAMPCDVGTPERLRVGLVFDGGKPLHRLNVAENIALPLRYHRARNGSDVEARTKELLELTELSPLAERMPGTIGRSWEKRLGLARALILEPDLLLLDDPLGGLDSRHIIWWLQLLDKLCAGHPFMNKRPVTIVVATHNLRPWRNRTINLAVLGEGRFLAVGRCADLSSVTEPLVREILLEEALGAS